MTEFLLATNWCSRIRAFVSEVDADLVYGPEDLEPAPEVGPGGALLDLAHVDDPALLHLALALLVRLALLLLAALALAGEALGSDAVGAAVDKIISSF